jgi:hypothetical protein
MELRRSRDALVGVRLTAWPMSRVRALASAPAGDADALEPARLKFPAAAIAVLEFTGTWQKLGPERARLTTSVGAAMRDIRRSARPTECHGTARGGADLDDLCSNPRWRPGGECRTKSAGYRTAGPRSFTM